MNKYDVLAIFFPNKCLICSGYVRAKQPVCRRCKREVLERRNFTIKVKRTNKFFSCYSLGIYQKYLRYCILRYKFMRKLSYARKFAWAICEIMPENEFSNYDMITYVPLSENRLKTRGYNQAEILARKISENIEVELVGTLSKIKENRVQASLSREERIKNVKGVYKTIYDVRGKNIIIVDDILTTGATLNECAKMLYQSGAKNVIGICVATKRDWNELE